MAEDNVKSEKLPFSFWALNISQFLGAMNDNAYRWVMALALVSRASTEGKTVESPMTIAAVVFAIPFILFSSAGGVIADRMSKRKVIVIVNLCEVIVMALGLFAFLWNVPFLIYTVLFLMATQSAIFGPNKMGILPEIVRRDQLSMANGLFESLTYLAIIFGTVLGGLLFKAVGSDVDGAATTGCWRASIFFIAVALIGFLCSLKVKDTGARASNKVGSIWFWDQVGDNLRKARKVSNYLHLTIFAIAFFLFLGSYVQINVMAYGTDVLGMIKGDTPNLFLPVALGIGLGSFMAGRISGKSIELGLVPLGSIIVSASLLSFILPGHSITRAVVALFILGIGGGFFIVPLYAYMQQASPEKDRGEIIATSSFFSFVGVFLAGGVLMVLEKISPDTRFVILGVVTVGVSVWVVYTLPDFLIRFVGLIVTRFLYRLNVVGRDNVPLEGPTLLVCNHVSYIDAALLGATHQRRIRFMMARSYYNHPWFKWLFRLMQAIPISMDDSPKNIVQALREGRRALEEGYMVCIFAEGEITRTGSILEFKRGFEKMLKGMDDVPVIPVCLHGVWGSMFSYYDGRPMRRWPRVGRRVSVRFGNPMPSSSRAFDVRLAVMELQSRAFEEDKRYHRSLPEDLTKVVRNGWWRPCVVDTLGRDLSYAKTLIGSLALAKALRERTRGQKYVGVLLPNSVGGVLANLAVAFLGKVVVNLNYTTSIGGVRQSVEQSGIKNILTSRQFVERIGMEELSGLVYLEDVAPEITKWDKACAFLRAKFMPLHYIVYRDETAGGRPDVDDPAIVLFSSGSTAKPKGVVLSHYNLLSNVEAIDAAFRIGEGDVVCGVLPFFHAFGLTATLWLPLLTGIRVAYHPNPLEGEKVGELCSKYGCTLLLSTPTFLLLYLRKVKPVQFASLRYVVAGAEKMKPRIAKAFHSHFGVNALEGYGATELSPVAALNLADVEAGGIRQVGNKPGTIGRPLPGVTMKIVDPENPEIDLGYDAEGMLLVRGPNVMLGYLNDPGRTAGVLRNGWYITGDVARIDHDGFVTITDRLSRFSKIGGEMVPHMAIEEKIQDCLGKTQQVCGVTSLPDEKRGERLYVLLTPEAGDPAEVHRLLRESDLPNLWTPALRDFILTDKLPILGSGKMDLKRLRELVQEAGMGTQGDQEL